MWYVPKTVFIYLVVQLVFIRSFSQRKTLLVNMPRLGTSPGTYGLAGNPVTKSHMNASVLSRVKCRAFGIQAAQREGLSGLRGRKES